MIGQTISNYKILEKLGEGGMGVVYKAQDLKLDRLVALKFLPHHLTVNEAEKARFLQEAKAASALNHPNVCTIYGIEEHEGPAYAGASAGTQQFIEMEFVEGQTLSQSIVNRQLSIDNCISYAMQIGEALQEAHSKGIVHRDIKAENIMVNTKKQIKVMDFGLAKLKGSLKLTRASSTVGTLAYMSPEQIQGGELDTRSDIFSFGVVFYEMLTGQMPFRGEHEAAIMYSIVNEVPTPADKYRPELSPDCLHILQKALEKDPEDRYQHVDDMVVDLRRLKKQSTKVSRVLTSQELISNRPTGGSGSLSPAETCSHQGAARRFGSKQWIIAGVGLIVLVAAVLLLLRTLGTGSTDSNAGRKMLAVLPLENLGSPEQEYFADGLTEEITNRLSGLSGLGVIARTSAMQYKKTAKTLQQIGSELGASYVIQGTIRWGASTGGNTRVRVSPVLIKVSDGTQVWAQSYDAVFSDVFKIQADIASQVSNALGVTLVQSERKTLEATHTENSEAYDAYLRGNDYFRRSYEERDFRIALQMLDKAVELDPKFALAYARLSEVHSAMYWFHFDHTKERLARAKAAVDKALKLDPESPDAHASLGYYYYWGYLDYEHALKELTWVQKVRPNDSRVLLGIGSVYRRQGNFELAAATMTKAAELDPRSSEVSFNTSQTYTLLRNYAEAERYIDRSLATSPDLASRYNYKALIYLLWTGDTKRARSVLQQALAIQGVENEIALVFNRAFVELAAGNTADALTLARSGPQKPFDDQFEFIPKAQLFAQIYGLKGERQLERIYYDSARVLSERKVLEQPDDARYHSALGIAYAGCGRKDDAVREGKRGVELMPISMEAWRGTFRVRDLARIYVMVGDHSAALDQLEVLLSKPSAISAPLLRIDPVWAPLRNDPRFKKMTEHN